MNQNRVLVSDLDGVVNHWVWYRRMKKRRRRGQDTSSWRWLDPACLNRLDEICESTDARLVISSGWRHYLPEEQIRKDLRRAGLRTPVLGFTPKLGPHHPAPPDLRWKEIEAWREANPWATRICILEDCAGWVAHFPRGIWVQPDIQRGLTWEQVREAKDILRR